MLWYLKQMQAIFMRLSDRVAKDCRAERFTIHLKHITARSPVSRKALIEGDAG
jgi:hypothetical protein